MLSCMVNSSKMWLRLLYCTVLLLAETVYSSDVQIGPNVKLPSTYDVQVVPAVPVLVNMSIVLFEIISIDEPNQVEFLNI